MCMKIFKPVNYRICGGGMDTYEVVKKLVLDNVHEKLIRISLKLDFRRERSKIYFQDVDKTKVYEIKAVIGFSTFARAVRDAFEERFGEFKVDPLSFREDVLRNDRVELVLSPTGGLGLFDIWVNFRGN